MTNEEYQEDCMRTIKTVFFEDKLTNGAIGLSAESGEVAGIVDKYIFQGHPLNQEHLAEELGDVLFYITVMTNTLGISLDYIMERNVKKRQKRYPQGFSKERSVNREVAK